MGNILIYMGCGSILLMIALGFVKYLVVDNFYLKKPWYYKYQKFMQIALLALTIICILSFATILIIFLINEFKN